MSFCDLYVCITGFGDLNYLFFYHYSLDESGSWSAPAVMRSSIVWKAKRVTICQAFPSVWMNSGWMYVTRCKGTLLGGWRVGARTPFIYASWQQNAVYEWWPIKFKNWGTGKGWRIVTFCLSRALATFDAAGVHWVHMFCMISAPISSRFID